jgi:hypothetical protein
VGVSRGRDGGGPLPGTPEFDFDIPHPSAPDHPARTHCRPQHVSALGLRVAPALAGAPTRPLQT